MDTPVTTNSTTTLVLGASNKPDRYSYKALRKLREHHIPVAGIHPKLSDFEDFQIFPDLRGAKESFGEIDTVTVYLSPERSQTISTELIHLKPRRVIFNPGAENPTLAEQLEKEGIEVVNACTLVLLATEQF